MPGLGDSASWSTRGSNRGTDVRARMPSASTTTDSVVPWLEAGLELAQRLRGEPRKALRRGGPLRGLAVPEPLEEQRGRRVEAHASHRQACRRAHRQVRVRQVAYHLGKVPRAERAHAERAAADIGIGILQELEEPSARAAPGSG